MMVLLSFGLWLALLQSRLKGGTVPTKAILKAIPDRTGQNTEASLYGKLPGPVASAPDSQDLMLSTVLEMAVQRIDGVEHKTWEQLQDAAAASVPGGKRADGTDIDPRSLNFVLPRVQTSTDEPPFLASVVVIADPEDASRLARRHTKKQPNFTPLFFQSLIATTDNGHWRTQRTHLNEVFLPGLSLAKIFPTSWARAKKCADIMGTLASAAGEEGVQVHEFFLHEAQAQLQMASSSIQYWSKSGHPLPTGNLLGDTDGLLRPPPPPPPFSQPNQRPLGTVACCCSLLLLTGTLLMTSSHIRKALFGMDEDFMENTNKPIRDAFSGINPDPNYAKDMCLTMLKKVGESDRFATASRNNQTPLICSRTLMDCVAPPF